MIANREKSLSPVNNIRFKIHVYQFSLCVFMRAGSKKMFSRLIVSHTKCSCCSNDSAPRLKIIKIA
jgi:hypothetical protein